MIAFQGKSLARESRWRRLGKSIWKNRMIYMLLLPGVLWYVIFLLSADGRTVTGFQDV